MNIYSQQLAASPGKDRTSKTIGMSANGLLGLDHLDKDESDSLSGYSDDENHKRKQRRYR